MKLLSTLIKSLLAAYRKKFLPIPWEYSTDEVMDAWAKIDRILANAYMESHVDTAQNMLNKMIRYFRFTAEQCESPLITGMQEKINKARLTVHNQLAFQC